MDLEIPTSRLERARLTPPANTLKKERNHQFNFDRHMIAYKERARCDGLDRDCDRDRNRERALP